MALVKNPAGGVAASGKIGGTVYARNRAGQYARAWAKPVNPGTVRQSAVRAAFAAATTGWGGLTIDQQESWDAYAATMTRLNRLGEPYTPKGRQIYMETAQNLQIVGLAALGEPGPTNETPALDGFGAIVVETTANNLSAFTIASFSTSPAAAGLQVVIEAAPIHEAKLSNVNNQFRQIFTGPAETGPNLLAAFTAVFGTPAIADHVLSFRARVVQENTGLGSAWLLHNAQVIDA